MKNNNFFNEGRTEYDKYTQVNVLNESIERSIQDLFLKALRTQDEIFNYIFINEEKVDDFCNSMISYWEHKESYEKCAEIITLKKSLKYKLIIEENPLNGSLLREWLKKSF